MTKDEQLTAWLSGKSTHCDEENIHVPDFSCCYPHLRTPKKVKKLYLEALANNDIEQIEFFERMFVEELRSEMDAFEKSKEISGETSVEMFADVVERIRDKTKK